MNDETFDLTFAGVRRGHLASLSDGDIAILGVSEATPYVAGTSSHAAAAPNAIRAAMARFSDWHAHYDFDLDKPLLQGIEQRIADCGNLAGNPDTPAENRSAITDAVQRILHAGAKPIVIGGDDSVPTPVIEAFRDHGPIWIVQIDAHIDWRDERYGERLGWSSTMRRASEMGWVQGITHIGIRGVGSARASDVRDARAWGAEIYTARQVHDQGVSAALSSIPKQARCLVTMDCDAMAPSEMPAVLAKAPGGLTYYQILDLIKKVGATHNLIGFNLVELVPKLDLGEISSRTAGSILCAAIHSMA